MSWPLDLFDKVLIVSKIHLLTESSIDWLKQQAKSLKKSKSISLSQAQYEIAVQQSFSNWKNLVDTFKYETNSRFKYRLTSAFLPDYEPIRKEAHNLYLSRIDYSSLSNVSLDIFQDNQVNSNIKNTEIWDKSFLEIAQKKGFNTWEQLKSHYQKETILSEYTDEQKIGAISRSLGINPKAIKNSIFVVIEDSEDVWNIGIDEWESLGFYEDYSFVRWLENNDPYFHELGLGGQIFRVISVDTNAHKTAEKRVARILKNLHKKHDFFFPIFSGFIWINGKIDPRSIEIDPEYPNDPLPLAELPEVAWKRGY
jgi:hypothetical protein